MTIEVEARTPVSVLSTLAFATLTASLGLSVASVLLPTLTKDFSATVSDVQWVVLAYLISVTVTIVSAGRLGDLFGHRRVLLAGLVIFIAASVWSAMAPGLGALIAGRALQGMGGAILMALPMSIARDLVPADRLGTAMGLLGTTSASGTALGPSLGGLMLAGGDWRWAFWLLAGFAIVTLFLSMTAISVDRQRVRPSLKALDAPGTLVLVIALAAYALATSGTGVGLSFSPVFLMALAALATALFVTVEKRAASPLVPMALLLNWNTGGGFLMNLSVGAIMMTTLVVGPFFLAFSLGLNDALIGLVLAVGPFVAALSGVPAGRLTDRLGVRRVMILGLMQITAGALCLAFLPRVLGVSGYVIALISLTPAFQLFLAANNTAVLVHAPREQRGRLSGLLGLSRNLGLMTGASAMSSLFVVFLGRGEVAQAPGADVARAFSMTFTGAAVLALMTLGLAIYSTGRGQR
ncbi:MFS transporter [Nitratireductor sp. GISD-1A_MAKvit]|uniref:MFS transporter n=1 Tax=Nitratireductor sp. GISD-1A_MAKvit TaxID=3234198 RepID=UPI0034678EFB